jgi:outer membrane lipopolysaccharide assembly protein LptE/RlpB
MNNLPLPSRRRTLGLAALLLLVTAVTGCGYTFLSTAAPFGRSTITVIPFREQEPVGISQSLAHHLALRLAQGGVSVQSSPSTSAATLSGKVISARVSPSPASAVDVSVPSYRVQVQLQVVLSDNQGTILWKRDYNLKDTFLAAKTASTPDSILVTEAYRRRTIERLAAESADQIYQDLILSSSIQTPGDTSHASAH